MEQAWSNPGEARGQYMGCMGWLFSGHLQNPVFVVNKNREYPFVRLISSTDVSPPQDNQSNFAPPFGLIKTFRARLDVYDAMPHAFPREQARSKNIKPCHHPYGICPEQKKNQE